MTTTPTPGPISGTLNPDGFLTCGCIVRALSVEWCPLHAAAAATKQERDELLALVRRVAFDPIGPADARAGIILDTLTNEARALLARIEGKE